MNEGPKIRNKNAYMLLTLCPLCSAEAKSEKKADNGWDSVDEAISTAEEKKHSIKNLIKRRLRQRSITRPDAQHKGESLERDKKPGLSENGQSATLPKILQSKLEVVNILAFFHVCILSS